MRFVVVEIPDNDEAAAFVSAIRNNAVVYGRNVDGEVQYGAQKTEWKVPQVYAVPTLFCECIPQTQTSARSSKYGWWVCVKCSKPHKGAMQHPYNLLEYSVPAQQRVYYMGFRADRRPWRLASEKDK